MPGWDQLPGVEGHEKFNWLDSGRSIRADWSQCALSSKLHLVFGHEELMQHSLPQPRR